MFEFFLKPLHAKFIAANQLYWWLWAGIFLLVVFAPLFALIADLINQTISGVVSWSMFSDFGVRRFLLLLQSIRLSFSVAATAVFFGTLAAIEMWTWNRRPFVHLRWFVVLFAALPPYIHALAWSTFLTLPGDALGFFGLDFSFTGGWVGSWLVQTMAFLPLSVALSLLGLESVDPHLTDAAKTFCTDSRVLTKIALPLAAPAIFAGGGFIFVFSLADYSVPSLFGVNVYALEVFAEHSVTGKPASAFMMAMPLLALAALVVFLSQSPLRKAAMQPSWKIRPWPKRPIWYWWMKGLIYIALTIVAFQILVPLFGLTMASAGLESMKNSFNLAQREITFSVGLAMAVALLAIPLAYPAAVAMSGPGRKQSIWWFLITFSLAIPAPLIGIGLIAAWNQPLFGGIYGSEAMPILASLARFSPFAALLILAYLRRIDPLLIDAARVFQTGAIANWRKIRLPLLAPGLLAACCLVFILTLGELGATLIIAPPGMATVTMRIYTLLHYGATDMVAGLCLMMALITVFAGIMICFLLMAWNRFRLRTG